MKNAFGFPSPFMRNFHGWGASFSRHSVQMFRFTVQMFPLLVFKCSEIRKRIAKALDVDPLTFFKDQNNTSLEYEQEIQRKKSAILLRLEKEIDAILHSKR